ARVRENITFLKVQERGAGFIHVCRSSAVETFVAVNKLGFVEDRPEIFF
ncbi:unnamed protein product, partial [Choristocarpus tenellus]